MAHTLETVKKAQPQKVRSAWLALSDGNVGFEKRLSLSDIIISVKPDGSYEKANATQIWQLFAQHGLFIHPLMKIQYSKQRTCIFCGGLITRSAITTQNWEDRCSTCGFMYEEG